MKLKNEIPIKALLKYGFEIITEEDKNWDETFTMSSFDYKFNIGHTRRGQFYFILISDSDRIFNVWASKPDGSGSFIGIPNVLVDIINDGLIEKDT